MVSLRRHLGPLAHALVAVFALSVWVLPVANAMQQQGGCCSSAEAHASADAGCCDNADCCYAGATSCCDHSGETDPDAPTPDAPQDSGCDCDCCGVIVVTPPTAVLLLPGSVLPVDSPSPVSTTPTARPDSAALGVSIPPPIA